MIGKTISHYKILEKLGAGGMGIVYKAQDTKLDRLVALKFLPPHLSQAEEEKKRFIHEAKAASALDHPNICTIYEIGETEDGQMFIAMAFYDGESLKDRIDRGPLPIGEAIDIVVQVALGLEKAHSKEIVHRDIKPANVLITEDSQVKIVDFGLAKLAGRTMLTKKGTTLGTVAYMSPEQTQGTEVDHRTDIWALGVVLYEMLTGDHPFKGDYEQAVMYSIMNEDLNLSEKVVKQFPDQLITLLEKSLQKDISRRTASATEFKTDLEKIRSQWMGLDGTGTSKVKRYFKPTILIPVGIIVLFASLLLVRKIHHSNRIQWAEDVALAQIEDLTAEAEGFWDKNIEAFELAVEAEKYIPDNPKLHHFMKLGSGILSIITQPAGAQVYRKPFNKPENDWEFIGTTPILSRRMPYYLFRWKIENPGYETQYRASWSGGQIEWDSGTYLPDTLECVLDKSGTLPPNMVRISGTGEIADFFIDKHEVTNQQFKSFVENGGYRDKTFWKHPFMKNGKKVSWEEAVAEFKDMTGRLGPATWEGGSYLEGEVDYPVSGISWYEAAAYAEFAGKSLPTVSHWGAARAGRLRLAYHLFYPMSNFGGKGPVPGGTTKAMTPFGIYDMAGNVREWCWNESELGRCIRGGSWNDATYMFANITQADPFNRSPKNGFRCVIYPERDKLPGSLFEPRISEKPRNFYKEAPVSDAIFNIYKDMFSYDNTDLMESVDETHESSPHWIYHKASFSAAYDDERVTIHLFLPRNTTSPYQTVIYFPGSGSVHVPSSDDMDNYLEFTNQLSFFLKDGRAVAYPVYKGTFERRDGIPSSLHMRNDESHEFKDYMIKVVKDFKRVIDYLETRPDIDKEKLAYFGFSWGGWLAGIILAVEERIQVAIINVGGFWGWGKPKPEVDPVNYVPRITIPTLMLNGRFDMTFPYETTSKPMFDLLGTPSKDKKQIVYETDHLIPRKELIKESLNWLDRYFGPAK